MEKLQSQSKNLTVKRILCYIILILLAFISLFPFYTMIINATRSHEQIQRGFSALPGLSLIENFVNLTTGSGKNYPIITGMINSIFIGTLTALLTTYFSAMTSYGIYMYNFKGKNFAFKFILAVMMVPTQVSTLGFLKLLQKMHLMNNYVSLIVPAIAAPVVFFYMYQSMEATLPYSIVEAARVDGCHEFRTFNQIVVPMMKPAIAVQAIFAFVSSWNNYFVPNLVINDKNLWTVPIVIANARNADYMNWDQGINYMLMTVAILPLIIVYLFLSRYIISGATAGGVKE
ncbi:MAG: carbohydrate ABC transporter permease [Treponema sp.]|nr:carbohydrate ABC transporter permease [Treponema sp.]